MARSRWPRSRCCLLIRSPGRAASSAAAEGATDPHAPLRVGRCPRGAAGRLGARRRPDPRGVRSRPARARTGEHGALAVVVDQRITVAVEELRVWKRRLLFIKWPITFSHSSRISRPCCRATITPRPGCKRSICQGTLMSALPRYLVMSGLLSLAAFSEMRDQISPGDHELHAEFDAAHQVDPVPAARVRQVPAI